MHYTPRKLALAATLSLIATGTSQASSGQLDQDWGAFGSGQSVVSFDLGGNLADTAADSALAADGSLYLVGTVKDSQGLNRIGIAKLKPDGALLDTSFSGDGKAISLLTNVVATSVALTEDLIYVAGFKTGNAPDYDMVVCRFSRSTGAVNAFPGSQSVCVSPVVFAGEPDIARDIVVQPDGKFVIAGSLGATGGEYAAFARFQADGLPDLGFGTLLGSNVTAFRDPLFDYHRIEALDLASNGKLVAVGATNVGGTTDEVALTIRLLPDGTKDREFAIQMDGNPSGDTALLDVVAVDGPGVEDALIVSGLAEFTAGKRSGLLAKFRGSDLSPDPFFGEENENFTAITLAADSLEFADLAVEPNGAIVTLGLRRSDVNGDDLLVRRFNADGFRDNKFGNNGTTVLDLVLPDVSFHGPGSIAVQGDAAYVTGWALRGETNSDFIAAKLITGDGVFGDSFED